MIKLPYIQTNVFTDHNFLFSGNQLATFFDLKVNSQLSDEQMLGLAREINFSEITFILPSTKKQCDFKVKILTPDGELPFAGHPSIGTAFVLKKVRKLSKKATTVTIELPVGPITMEFENQKIIMNQPKPIFLKEYDQIEGLIKSLGLKVSDISFEHPIQFVSTGNSFLLIHVKSLATLQELKVDRSQMVNLLQGYPTNNVYLFTTETKFNTNHIHARMIAPADVIFEDPATGSAAGPIAAYIERYNVLKDHIRGDEIIIEQGYEMKRPSKIRTKIIGEKGIITGVKVMGEVKLTLEGNYYL